MTLLEKLILELKNNALQSHYYCDDSWYSCPKSEEGSSNEELGNECNCGADEHNQKVEELYKAITELITTINPNPPST